MKTVINIKADKEVKENAQSVAEELGFSLSAVINAYLREFIRTRSLHFSTLPQMTPVLEKLLGGAEQDIKQGKNLSPAFSSAKAASQYLDLLK